MLQQTQVKTVIPYWERWMRELPTIESLAKAPSEKIHKLWEGLGYYTRVRNMQKGAQQIIETCGRRGNEAQNKVRNPKSEIRNKLETPHPPSLRSGAAGVVSYQFPEKFDDVLALPGIGRYTAGAICSIAFNQPTPILDGNVIRVLTRVFGIAKDPREKETNTHLWKLAGELVCRAKFAKAAKERISSRTSRSSRDSNCCSFLNQSLMELGALICTPKNAKCAECPIRKYCIAFQTSRVEQLPNLGPRTVATSRRFAAFVFEKDGHFLVRQRPAGVVNAHLWEFPNVELNGAPANVSEAAHALFGFAPRNIEPLCTIKHSITRYRITLDAFSIGAPNSRSARTQRPSSNTPIRRSALRGCWLTLADMKKLSFPSAHKKILAALENSAD